MPKLKRLEPITADVTTEGLVKELTWQLRKNRLLHDPDPAPEARQNQLDALILSIRSEREVRLTRADFPPGLQLDADAYLYDPKTQTMKETD
tara:strand:- start:237 stop:512 length:276 start_codon:yes stop_codon:yes gene_type:complete